MSCDHEETIEKPQPHAACMCCKSQYEFWQLSKLNLFDSTNSKPVLTPDTLPVSDMHRTTPFTAGPSTRHPFSFLAMDVTVNAQLQEPRFAFALNLEAGEKEQKTRENPSAKACQFLDSKSCLESCLFGFLIGTGNKFQ